MGLTAQEALARTVLLTRQLRLPESDDDTVVRGMAATTVAIVADEENLSSPVAQDAVTTLVGLTAACGMRVRLVMPPVQVAGYQPPLVGDELTAALCDLASDSVPGADAAVASETRGGDVAFIIGSSEWRGTAEAAWRLTADAWCGSMLPTGANVRAMSGGLPIGALAAASAAAAEPYRVALRRIAAATGCAVADPRLLQPAERVVVRLAPPGTPTSGFALGSLDMVSGGALTTAVLHALLRVDDLGLAVRVWEPQDAEGTNLNRYVLLRRSMLGLGMSKVRMLERWQHGDVSISGSRTAVDEDNIQTLRPWAPWVFVGTDNVEARWLVQRSWPEHLVVVGTAGFLSMASEHDCGRPCAGCLHPGSENLPGLEVPTISFVSYLGGLLGASRLLRWSVAGRSADAEQETEAYADRLDSETGIRHAPVARLATCPVGCAARDGRLG